MRTRAIRAACLAALVACARWAPAQQQAVAVQLPTFSFFSVNTSVVVPDSGAGIRAAMAREAAGGLRRPHALTTVPVRRESESFSQELAAARRSSAGRGSASVAALRAAQSSGQPPNHERADALRAKADQAEADGKPEVAKVYRRMADRHAGTTESAGRVARAPAQSAP